VKNIYSITDSIAWSIKALFYKYLRYKGPFKYLIEKENNSLQQLIEHVHDIDGHILDLGTGTGNVIRSLPYDTRVTGIDINLHMLKVARSLFHSNFVIANLLALPVKNESIGFVTLVGILEYIAEPDTLFKELIRVLKQDSCAIVTYSPDSTISRLRKLTGNRVIIRNIRELEFYIEKYGFEIVEAKLLNTQHQLLIKKR